MKRVSRGRKYATAGITAVCLAAAGLVTAMHQSAHADDAIVTSCPASPSSDDGTIIDFQQAPFSHGQLLKEVFFTASDGSVIEEVSGSDKFDRTLGVIVKIVMPADPCSPGSNPDPVVTVFPDTVHAGALTLTQATENSVSFTRADATVGTLNLVTGVIG